MKQLNSFFFAIVCVAYLSAITTAEQVEVDSTVTDVTLYRDQARVTRTLNLNGDAKPQEIVVSDLPENVLPDSLFAESDAGVEVRAVQFRTRAVGDSPREEVRQLEAEIRALDRKIEFNQKQTELLNGRSKYLDKLENFVAPSASTELSKGVLDAAALKEVTEFNFAKREEIAQKQIDLSGELFDLQQEKVLSQRKLAEITNGSSRTIREAILFVQKDEPGAKQVRLSYLVGACGWSPSYTIRAGSDRTETRVEYNGLIHQMSGEDWNDVQLTLSTASPALSSSGPGLAPFKLTLVPGGPSQNGADANYQLAQPFSQNGQSLKQIYSQQREAIYAVQNSLNNRDNFANSWGLNDTVNQLSCVELISEPAAAKDLKRQLESDGEQPSLSYKLTSGVSLTSRNSQQMVRILQTDLPSDFYHVATPILTSYVYREAELNNSSQEDLLAGPITVYLDGRFVGRGEIPTVARGQTFVVGLGADSQLRTRRELVEKQTDINGGNREIHLDYRLVIENYKETPVKIRVSDRLPNSEKEKDIKVTLDDPQVALSTDKVYLRDERPKGILRWDTEVPARAVGESLHEIDYGFSMEFDRKYQVAVAGDRQQQRQEFEEMQNKRIKR